MEDAIRFEIGENEWNELTSKQKERMRVLVLDYFDFDIEDAVWIDAEEDDK